MVLGNRDDLLISGVELSQVTWTDGVGGTGDVMVQYRAHGDPVVASLVGTSLMFEEPQEAIAPGQTVAFYNGERVLGGALITSTNL